MAKVLVVDDEPGYRASLSKIAAREGHVVRQANSAREAMEIAAEFTPDILVIDWMLQNGCDGVDLATRLSKVDPNLVVVLISGYPSAELEAEAEERGFRGFLAKPFDLDRFVEMLRRVTD